MKIYVYPIICHGGEWDDRYEYLDSIYSTFEGAKAEAIRLAEVANDKEAADLSKVILNYVKLNPNLDRSEWTEIEHTFFHVINDDDPHLLISKGSDSAIYSHHIEVGAEEIRD